MLYMINETDTDRIGNISSGDNASVANAIDKNKRENPTLQAAVLPSPQQQQKEKNGQIASVTVDGSKGGAQAIKNADRLMATNPDIKKAVDNGNAQVVVDYGRGTSNLSEDVRKRMEEELRRFELNESTILTMDGKSFKEYLCWKKQ